MKNTSVLKLLKGQMLLPESDKANMSSAKIPPKPKCPLKVFTDGILEYTIVKYTWHDGSMGIKRGWFPLKKFNSKHPNMIKRVARVKRRQNEILDRKRLTQKDWDRMRQPMTI